MDCTSMPTVSRGHAGPETAILQQKLAILGLFPGAVTQSFGPDTEAAVKQFQLNYGLPPTGSVDTPTWNELYVRTDSCGAQAAVNMKRKKPTLRRGNKGADVTELQTMLKQLMYYNHPITGMFGTNTENSVKAFQKINRLTADGIAGPVTWSNLYRLWAPAPSCGVKDGYITYTVRQGDTLYNIARGHDLTVSAIKAYNGLTGDVLKIGQTLKIPSGARSAGVHTPGESSDGIQAVSAEIPPEYDGGYIQAAAAPARYNAPEAANSILYTAPAAEKITGDSAPAAERPDGASPAQPTRDLPHYESNSYTVTQGDSLWSIAKLYGTTPAALKAQNGLAGDMLSVGQVLIIPPSVMYSGYRDESFGDVYTVKKGDSLWSIAQKYWTAPETLRTLNGLTGDELIPGQVIIIPTVLS